jgi:hypothetical protein
MSANQKKHQVDHTQKPAKKGKKEGPVKKKIELAQMLEAPDTMRQGDVINAQQQAGNQVVTRALDKKGRRESVTDEQGNLKTEISATIQGERGGGSPLPGDIAKEASKKFKRKFDDVRLHTDEKADQLSRKIQARAFTIGKDIFFKKGVFSPGTSQGRETLVHELTHVVQQSGSRSSTGQLKLGASDTAQEQEADRIGKQNSMPKSAPVGTSLSSSVQKYGEDEEELLQGQEEEEELQMQEEEEELLQGQEDEEELQMQQEEEEIQTQPGIQSVIQRDNEDYEEREKIRGMIGKSTDEMFKAKAPIEEISQVDLTMKNKQSLHSELSGFDRSKLKHVEPTKKPETLTEQIRGFDRSKLKHVEPTKKPKTLTEQIRGFDKSNLKHVDAPQRPDLATRMKEGSKYDIKGRRESLKNKIKDPTTSSADAQKYSEELQTLHKNAILPNAARGATGTRLKTLKRQAREGKEGAYEQYQKEYSKSSTYEKFLSKGAGGRTKMVAKGIGKGAKKVGSGLWGAAKGLFGSTAKDLKTHFFGAEKKKEEKKEEKPAPAPNVSIAMGGSGIMEKYANLLEKNMELKAKIKELEKE